MTSSADRFHALPPDLRREIHLNLCTKALEVWLTFGESEANLHYIESVCGTSQTMDRSLPGAAILSVIAGEDMDDVAKRYLEPITALQEGDVTLPREVEFAYYAIYNLFQKYIAGSAQDDWLIVNQSLSALGQETEVVAVLDSLLAELGA